VTVSVAAVNISNAATVNEGDTAGFQLALSQVSDCPVTVYYQTVDGTALAGVNYSAAPSSAAVTIAASATTAYISVGTIDDQVDEPDEYFSAQLTGADGASVGSAGTASATIHNIDMASASISGPASVGEGQAATFTLGLAGVPPQGPASGSWEVVWGDGSTPDSGSGPPPAVLDHTFQDQPGEQDSVVFSFSDSAGTTTAGLTVAVENVPPTVIIDGAHQNSPTGQEIDLSADVFDPGSGYGDTFSYQWSVTKDGYAFDPGTGETSPTLDFTPADAGNYSVSLTVTDADGGTGTASATTNVSDGLTISVSGATVAEGDAATFTVTLSRAPAATVTVCFATQSGVAPGSPYCAAGSGDFDDTSASWQVGPADSLSYYVTVQTHLDSAMQGDEQFAAVVSGYDGNNNPIPGDTGYGTIERITAAVTLHNPDGSAIPASQTASPGGVLFIDTGQGQSAELDAKLLTPCGSGLDGDFLLEYDPDVINISFPADGDVVPGITPITPSADTQLEVTALEPGQADITLAYNATVAGAEESLPSLAIAAENDVGVAIEMTSPATMAVSGRGQTTDVIVGQQVSLEGDISNPAGLPVANEKWEIPAARIPANGQPRAIAAYPEPSTTKAKATTLPEAPKGPGVQYYYVGAGPDTVTFSLTVGGLRYTNTATLNAVVPTSTFSGITTKNNGAGGAPPGPVSVSNNLDRNGNPVGTGIMMFGGNGAGSFGITLNGSVTAPNVQEGQVQAGAGRVQLVQLVSGTTQLLKPIGSVTQSSLTPVLDIAPGATAVNMPFLDPATGSLTSAAPLSVATGATVSFATVDLPALTLNAATYWSEHADATYTTYLMYQPGGANSIWVTLRTVSWGPWSGTATARGKTWSLKAGSVPAQASQNCPGNQSTAPPEWDTNWPSVPSKQ
jgi:hypothetical protein